MATSFESENRSKAKRYAPLGLYLSAAAAIAAAGLYIVYREWNLQLQIAVGLVVAGLAIFAILDPGKVRTAITGRQARYGSNAAILTLAFLGILVVVNYLGYTNTKQWDLTEDKENTLASETIETLKALDTPVTAKAYYTARTPTANAEKLLEQYKVNSNGKFTYEFIDPEQNMVAAQQAGVTVDGTVILTTGDRQEQVKLVSEQELTGSLVRLMSKEKRAIYFLTGHGELSPNETGDRSLSSLKGILENKNYTVQTLNLLATKQIPADAKLVVIAGPQKPLAAEEVATLDAFLGKGGAVIAMEEPEPVTQFEGAEDPLATYLAQNWGINLGKDFIIDVSSAQASAVAVGAQYGDHAITNKMQGLATVFPSARSVTVAQAPSGVSQTEMVMTSGQAWAETDLEALKSENAQVNPDEGKDLFGPVGMAVAAENFEKKSRLAVFGDADFISNTYIRQYWNTDLFVNTADWATGQENLINLTPKDTTQRLLMAPDKVTANLILLGTVFVLPGAALLTGIVTWIQRRKRV